MGFFSLKQKLFSAAKYFSTCYELFDFKAWLILLYNPDFPDLVIILIPILVEIFPIFIIFGSYWPSLSASDRHCGNISCHLPTTIFFNKLLEPLKLLNDHLLFFLKGEPLCNFLDAKVYIGDVPRENKYKYFPGNWEFTGNSPVKYREEKPISQETSR